MTKAIAPIGLLALTLVWAGDDLSRYHSAQAYEVRPGILATPVYAPESQTICEVGIERKRYSKGGVDVDGFMSKEQILLVFDELAPAAVRGRSGPKLPGNTEITEVDSGITTTRIPYENATLSMYRRSDKQGYVAAIISWSKRECTAK